MEALYQLSYSPKRLASLGCCFQHNTLRRRKDRLTTRPKVVNVAYTTRYLCNAAKVAYDIRRLPDLEVCVRTQTCIGGSRWGCHRHFKMDGLFEKTERLFAYTEDCA